MLCIVGVGGLRFVGFLIVNPLSAFACLMTRLLAVATGFRGAISGLSSWGFAFPFPFVVGRENVSLCFPCVVLDVGYDLSLCLYHNLVSPVA